MANYINFRIKDPKRKFFFLGDDMLTLSYQPVLTDDLSLEVRSNVINAIDAEIIETDISREDLFNTLFPENSSVGDLWTRDDGRVYLDTPTDKVGIGTDTPDSPLTVVGTTTDTIAKSISVKKASGGLSFYVRDDGYAVATNGFISSSNVIGASFVLQQYTTLIGNRIDGEGGLLVEGGQSGLFLDARADIGNHHVSVGTIRGASFGVGTSLPTARAHIVGAGNTSASSDNVLKLDNSVGQVLLVDGTGETFISGNKITSTSAGTGNTVYGTSMFRAGGGNYNTAMGFVALDSTTSGSSNTAIGYQAGRKLTTGTQNVAIGATALLECSTGLWNMAIGSASLQNALGNHNVGIGYQSLTNQTTGLQNVAIGSRIALGVTTGGNNLVLGYAAMLNSGNVSNSVAIGTLALRRTEVSNLIGIGYEALVANTTGANNMGIGYRALYTNTTGASNMALGNSALYNNTASNNTAIGYQSMLQNTAGTNNSAIGAFSMVANTTGSNNTAIGLNALMLNQTGASNTAIGASALYNNIASNNLGIGQSALFNTTTGDSNIGIGYTAMFTNTIGVRNIAIGVQALYFGNDANDNVAIGSTAMRNNVSGTGNVIIGYRAGFNTLGSANVFIGKQAGENELGSSRLYIADSNTATPLIYGEFDNELVKIHGQLNVVGAGNTSATFAQKIENSSGTSLLSVRDDGLISGYNNVWTIDSSGNIDSRKFSGLFGFFSSYVSAPYYLNDISGDIFFGDSSATNATSAVLGVYGRSVGANFILQGTKPATDQPISTSVIKGANAFTTAITNINGGDLWLDGGDPATGGTKGDVIIQGLTYPTADGTANQVLMTDGARNIDFATIDSSVTSGASGSFTTNDGKTITVTNGLITSIL